MDNELYLNLSQSREEVIEQIFTILSKYLYVNFKEDEYKCKIIDDDKRGYIYVIKVYDKKYENKDRYEFIFDVYVRNNGLIEKIDKKIQSYDFLEMMKLGEEKPFPVNIDNNILENIDNKIIINGKIAEIHDIYNGNGYNAYKPFSFPPKTIKDYVRTIKIKECQYCGTKIEDYTSNYDDPNVSTIPFFNYKIINNDKILYLPQYNITEGDNRLYACLGTRFTTGINTCVCYIDMDNAKIYLWESYNFDMPYGYRVRNNLSNNNVEVFLDTYSTETINLYTSTSTSTSTSTFNIIYSCCYDRNGFEENYWFNLNCNEDYKMLYKFLSNKITNYKLYVRNFYDKMHFICGESGDCKLTKEHARENIEIYNKVMNDPYISVSDLTLYLDSNELKYNVIDWYSILEENEKAIELIIELQKYFDSIFIERREIYPDIWRMVTRSVNENIKKDQRYLDVISKIDYNF